MPKLCQGDCIGAFETFYESCSALILADPNVDAYTRFLEACQGNGDATDFRPPLPAPGGPDALEVGTIFADEDDVTISFQRSYSRPIIFAGIPTENGDEEISVRVRSVSTDARQFVLYADVPSCVNDDHEFEQINWMVTEEGSFRTVQVGTVSSPADSTHGLDWVDAPFYSPIENAVVVTQVQTHTGGDWTKTRQRAVTADGFQIRLEEDGADTSHNQELFGWIATSVGRGTIGGLRYEAIATPAAVTHVPYEVTFSQKLHSPAIFGSIATFNGGDPAHLRQFSPLGNRGAQIFVEEDTCSDAEQAHAPEAVHILVMNPTYPAPPPPPPPPPPPADHLEVGTVWADESEVTIDYLGTYSDPVIVAGIPTEFGDEETVIRIISTTDSSFNVYADVPNHAGVGAVCGTEEHEPEMFNWLVTSAGSFQTMQAGKVQSSADTSLAFEWVTAQFPQPMDSAPAVISQIQTHTGGDFVSTRHQHVTATGFQLRLEEDGQDVGHNQETMGWIALPVGMGNIGGLAYEAIVTPAAVTHEPYDVVFSTRFRGTPALFGSMATFNGGDPAHLRQFSPVSDRGAQVFVEEDTCLDAEQAHAAESLALLVIQPTYPAPPPPPPPPPPPRDVLEVGTVWADESEVRVLYRQQYDDPVIVAGIPTEFGDEETVIRILRVTAGSFDVYADVPNHAGVGAVCGTEEHEPEMFNWLVTSAGSFQTMQAGKVQSSADTSLAFEWVTAQFPQPMDSAPAVISQIQTHTGGDFVSTRHQHVTATGFQLRLEEDGQDVGHNQETMGWIALPVGMGNIGGLAYEAIVTPAAVTHEPYDVVFSTRFRGTPALFGSMATFNGGDPAHLRQFSPVSDRGAQVFVEEDTCLDAEQAHAAESLALLVIQSTYPAPPPPPPPPPPPADHLEVGTVWADESEVTIDYLGTYSDPVIVAGIPTEFGDEETVIRIISTTDSSFNVYADVPNHAGVGAVCGTEEHEPEMFNWLVTSAGSFQTMQAGKVQSSADTSLAFEWVTAQFPQPMDSAPAVISQIQTHTGGDFVSTRHQHVTATGFQLRLEEDGQDVGHNQETMGWIALPVGMGNIGGLAYEAIVTPAAVTHEPYDVVFSTRFRGTPALFGSMATFNGPDACHLRQFSPVSDRGAQVFVEEDTCLDAEQAHAAESLALLVIQPTYSQARGPLPPHDCSLLDPSTYQQECPEITEWHPSIDMSNYVGTAVCTVLVRTAGSTCADYCASQGGVCQHAQDNQGGCDLAVEHERQDTSQNGCLQNWGDQICGCSGTSLPTPPPPPPPPPPPLPAHNCDGLDPSSYQQECASVTEWHPSIDMSQYVSTTVCNVLVRTAGGTCADYCTSQGETCRHAQDNQGGCELAVEHERQDTSQNGCLQNWGDQICGCSSSGGGNGGGH